MRREWIEIGDLGRLQFALLSPSMRREWIEMLGREIKTIPENKSPSMRREWIEMILPIYMKITALVSLHAEGVD